MPGQDTPKVVVLGLDGADWSVIDHMIGQGRMPTLASMKKNGAWGDLESTYPPITCPAWLVFGTGKNPGKLGAYFFLVRDGHKYNSVPFYFKRDVAGSNFWDILSRSGYKAGVINIPTVHQAYEINGFMIAGFMSNSRKNWLGGEEEDDLTYPAELGSEIAEKIGEYHINFPKTTSPNAHLMSLQEEIDEFEEVATQRSKALDHLMRTKEWDLIALDIMATDRMGHSMAQIICPEGGKYDSKKGVENRPRIEGFYSKIDSIVARIKKNAGENAYVFVISDHGMGSQTGKFAVNDWLIRKGYLRLKGQSEGIPKEAKPSLKKRIYRVLSRISRSLHLSKIIETIVQRLPGSIKASVPYPLKPLNDENVDWSRTKVFYRVKGQLFLNLKGREPEGIVEEKDAGILVDELIAGLREATTDHMGDHSRLRTFKADEIYSGKFRKYAPDLYFDFDGSYYHVDARTGHENVFEKAEDSIRGNHRPSGIFMIQHPDVKEGKFDGLRLMDIAPTVLHIFDEVVPADMDGKVMRSIYRKGTDLHVRKENKGISEERRRISSLVSKLRL